MLTELLDAAPSAARRIPRRWLYPAVFTTALAAGAAFRLWDLATKPGWQYDEGVYTGVARNLLEHGVIAEHVTYGAPWSPDLYQPPVWFVVLARWFALTGPSIYHARILGVLCSLVTLTVFWRLMARIHGDRAALYAAIPCIFDGWLLYVQRVSYLENMLLMLITVGMWLYQRALGGRTDWVLIPASPVMLQVDSGDDAEVVPGMRQPVSVEMDRYPWTRFALAGAVLGFAAVFKYTGVYVLAAVLLCWLIQRRNHRGHLVLLSAAVLVAAGCVLLEIRLYDAPGHDWWIQETMVQVRRVLGIQSSGGTLTSPAKGLHLLLAQYKVFAPSFIVAVLAAATGVRRLWACYQRRDWSPVQQNALLFSWMAAGLVIFGFSSLRYPQYFALILLPAYGFWWTETWWWQWLGWGRLKRTVALTAACVLGVVSFWARVGANDDNVFADVQAYAASSIPSGAVIVADEAIGDLIAQPYCREQAADPCAGHATYAISWNTYLQSTWSLGDPAYRQMMASAIRIRSWTGFNGTVTVWRLTRS